MIGGPFVGGRFQRGAHMDRRGTLGAVTVAVAVALVLGLVAASASAAPRAKQDKPADVEQAVAYDTSAPLAKLTPAPAPSPDTKKEHPQHKYPTPDASTVADPAVQSSVGTAAAPSLATNFEGVGQGFS